jgi:hypothetical protein
VKRKWSLAVAGFAVVLLVAGTWSVYVRTAPAAGPAATRAPRTPPSPPEGSLPVASDLPAPTRAASATPLVLIYHQPPAGRDFPPRRLDVAAWHDGRIVWRRDDGTLLQARIDTRLLDELLQRLHADGVFGDGDVRLSYTVPDGGWQAVEVRLADRVLELQSSGPREGHPNLIHTADGIEVLDGRDPEAVRAAQPPEFRRFRQVWSEIESTVRSWVPATGEPFTGPDPIGEAR